MASQEHVDFGSAPAADAFYIECSLPTGLTIADYRRLRPRHQTLWNRLTGRRADAPGRIAGLGA